MFVFREIWPTRHIVLNSLGMEWKTRAAQRKQAQLDSIPREWLIESPPATQVHVTNVPNECGLFSPREITITNETDVATILAKLASREWSSEEVTRAYAKRAIVAQQLTNCLTEIFIEKALQRAKELDDILEKTGKVVGPLHGLPISLKDQFTIKGLETIMGYVAWIGNYAESNCVLVDILYECGAVLFVRTNVPQTLMWGETHNNVFGRTVNPFNRRMTPGGSSGGEGALLALRGSPLGVGTDIGGSVRIPSVFCGLYTIRPSYERLPYYGAANSLEGQESISSVLGPMANSMTGVKIFTKAIIDSNPWNKDPSAIRKEWSEREYKLAFHGEGKGPLCFAIMWDNGIVKPHPPLYRAMNMVKKALEGAGHQVIDWENHRQLEIYKNAEMIFAADGGEDYRTECARSGEPVLANMSAHPEDPHYHLPLGDLRYQQHLVGEPYHRSAYELWQLHREKRDLRKSHLDHWEATVSRTGTGRPVDAIIGPATAYSAVPHGLNVDSFYTTMCNAMDYTTSAFPVTFVDAELDKDRHPPHEFYNYEDKAIYHLYDPEKFHGCPVGLQLIGRVLEEEAVIRMTEIVDEALMEFKKSSKF
ncbi:general amidase [Moniliophthora roreri MCA 2997]|uniref:amidase n=1 Tax=Moniliophthora roreri (strain MCA 2997) TaxID=1381753 RepID=V2XIY4_MONRO|nr:general amidase [Moniliophthora roreri MCA 2997]